MFLDTIVTYIHVFMYLWLLKLEEIINIIMTILQLVLELVVNLQSWF